MSIPPENIQVDRCYLTEGGVIRQVTSIGSDGWIGYKERVGTGPWLLGGTRKRRRQDFAAAAIREISCDWIPEKEG